MIEPVIPMQPVLVEEPFDHPDYLYQVKWDGVRLLAYRDESGLRLVNRKLAERTATYPEMATLPQLLQAKSTILDGEMVALGADGKPSFSAILKRDLVKTGGKVQTLVKSVPAYFMVFDLLYLDGKWMVDEPLERRQELLGAVLQESEQVKLVDSHATGVALFELMKQREMEGIVCKERRGKYLIGERSATWKKVKYFRTLHAVVGGATLKGGLVNSLLLGVYQEGQLLFIGKAGSGLNGADIQALSAFAKQVPEQKPPFANPPKLPRNTYEQLIYFPPQLVVAVKYLEWTSDMTLRNPTLQGFRERAPETCVL